ncbi:MAG: DUF72 domain-containing protein, partial [Calditrichia bacterium]
AMPTHSPVTIEFRNEDWWNDKVYELLRRYNISFCIFELGGVQSPQVVTAETVYLRLHGPGAKYQGKYSEESLQKWKNSFLEWAKEGKEVYCYFDNDEKGYAAQNAIELWEMVRKK